MLRHLGNVAYWLIPLLLLGLGLNFLGNSCSLAGHPPDFGMMLHQWVGEKNPEQTNGDQHAPGTEDNQAKPTATFNLRVSNPNKIEGTYYQAQEENWWSKFFCEIKIGEALLAAFTLLLFLYTARLYWATAKLADADRPYIFPGHFSITGMKTDGPVEVGFNFENCGRSPAYLENIVFSVRHSQSLPRKVRFEAPAIVEISFALAPGKIFFPAGNAKADITVPAEVKALALNGDSTLFVYGCVNFKETWGSKHFQRFAYRYAPATDQLINCGPPQYWGHS